MTKAFYSLGLIGYPLEHSISPAIHQAALQALQLSGEYKLYPIPPLPEGEQQFNQLIDRIRAQEITGLNVTIPHKQAVLPWLDELTPTAQAIGAVNTIYLENGIALGDNTDSSGFLQDIKSSKLWRENGTALILGAGGAARAVCYALAQAGWKVHIAARHIMQAERLVTALSQTESIQQNPIQSLELNAENIRPLLDDCNLIINATPVGMSPNINHNPWPSDLSLPAHVGVYDLVYNPAKTALLQLAQKSGCQTRNGMGMLVEQAALSFKLWTGLKPPTKTMFQATFRSMQ